MQIKKNERCVTQLLRLLLVCNRRVASSRTLQNHCTCMTLACQPFSYRSCEKRGEIAGQEGNTAPGGGKRGERPIRRRGQTEENSHGNARPELVKRDKTRTLRRKESVSIGILLIPRRFSATIRGQHRIGFFGERKGTYFHG